MRYLVSFGSGLLAGAVLADVFIRIGTGRYRALYHFK